MGKLYDACQYVIRTIEDQGLDPFKSRGAIALQTGFLISAVEPTDPDDPQRLAELRRAAENILGISLPN